MSGGKVINNHNRDKYTIKKYEYRSSDDLTIEPDEDLNGFVSLSESLEQKDAHLDGITHKIVHEDDFDSPSQNSDIAPAEVREVADSEALDMLYKKVEEFSDKAVKLEMALEAKTQEIESLVSKVRQEGYDNGYQTSNDELNANFQKELDEKQKMLSSSVQKLESSAEGFTKRLIEIEKELITTALAISSEVIKVEISHKSSQIATTLAKELLAKLHEASNIVIKVNSADIDFLRNELSENSKITLEADDAVSRGGVIVMSSMGNLDGTISSRLEKIIKEATDK